MRLEVTHRSAGLRAKTNDFQISRTSSRRHRNEPLLRRNGRWPNGLEMACRSSGHYRRWVDLGHPVSVGAIRIIRYPGEPHSAHGLGRFTSYDGQGIHMCATARQSAGNAAVSIARVTKCYGSVGCLTVDLLPRSRQGDLLANRGERGNELGVALL